MGEGDTMSDDNEGDKAKRGLCCKKAWLYPELPWGAPPDWDQQYMKGVR